MGVEMTIVVAWTTDAVEIDPKQKAWRHDLGARPKMSDVKEARAAIWLNKGTQADLVKATTWVTKGYPGSGRVFVYPTTEKDPLGRARKEIIA